MAVGGERLAIGGAGHYTPACVTPPCTRHGVSTSSIVPVNGVALTGFTYLPLRVDGVQADSYIWGVVPEGRGRLPRRWRWRPPPRRAITTRVISGTDRIFSNGFQPP